MGAVAIALLFAALALAGCVGGSGQPGPDAGDAGPTADGSDDQNTSPTDGTDGTVDDGSDVDDGSGGDGASDEDVPPPRTPADALPGHEPVDTAEGMAHYVIQGQAKPMTEVPGLCGGLLRAGMDAESQELFPTIANLTIHDPGDVAFFDVYLSAGSGYTDLSMTLWNQSGGSVAEADSFGSTNEYLFWQPKAGAGQDYGLEIWQACADPTDLSYTLEVWVWTAEDWNASHPFTDVFTRTYEWGQAEVAMVGSVSGGFGDAVGVTRDGSIDFGGYGWTGCAFNGGGLSLLPCPNEPYVSLSIVIDDDVAGQEVAAIFTTCSNDNDAEKAGFNICGETDNLNDTTGNPGPNELRASFCGVVNGISRDATDPRDGTGSGVWDQRGEMYMNADGDMVPHPGVGGLTVFLRGPQRGGGAICPDANPYTGPTTGTITLIAFKG